LADLLDPSREETAAVDRSRGPEDLADQAKAVLDVGFDEGCGGHAPDHATPGGERQTAAPVSGRAASPAAPSARSASWSAARSSSAAGCPAARRGAPPRAKGSDSRSRARPAAGRS